MKKIYWTLLILSVSFLCAATDFDVKKYGAKGDGIADDAPAIQKAIDAAQVNGGCVYFPAGRYRVRKTLSFNGYTPHTLNNAWITFKGAGNGSKLLGDGVDYILAGRPNPGQKNNWMNGARIENLTFTSFDWKKRCNGIDAANMLRFWINACNFIKLKKSIASELPSPHSIWIARIQNCLFSSNTDWAISIRRSFDVVISNNSIEHGDGGIQIGFVEDAKDAACNTLRIESNVIEGLNGNGKQAVKLCCVVGCRIVGNYFEANYSGDIEISPKKGGWFRGGIIAGNTFQPTRKQRETGVYGPIKLEKAIDVSIFNNFTTGPRLLHTNSKDLGRNIVVFGNTMSNPPSLGFGGATAAERKAYEQAVAADKMNSNRIVLSGKVKRVGIDTGRGLVFDKNTIVYADKAPQSGETGDIVFSRKPIRKNSKITIGWYCTAGGKNASWCPFTLDAAEK